MVVSVKGSDQVVVQFSDKSAALNDLLNTAQDFPDEVLEIPFVTSTHLEKIKEYCDYHSEQAELPCEIRKPLLSRFLREYACEFDLKFADAMDNPTIADLAERVLKIGNTYLLDLLVVAIVCRMKGKLPTQIQEEWGIKNTYTEEEVNKMKKEAVWVEEPVWSTQRAV
eukprot:GHVR01067628.1.p1 GENE.GHVR01067628.1~~GHVR01067628.1.p1  ORF type:complete len:168 (+),score=32.39 GHVR01067628.1:50-553(+)